MTQGRLQPTRAFGDFHLKHLEFNNPNDLPKTLGFRKIQDFRGPYITHRPEIRVFDISKQDRGYLLSSDGLFDELSVAEVAASE